MVGNRSRKPRDPKGSAFDSSTFRYPKESIGRVGAPPVANRIDGQMSVGFDSSALRSLSLRR